MYIMCSRKKDFHSFQFYNCLNAYGFDVNIWLSTRQYTRTIYTRCKRISEVYKEKLFYHLVHFRSTDIDQFSLVRLQGNSNFKIQFNDS